MSEPQGVDMPSSVLAAVDGLDDDPESYMLDEELVFREMRMDVDRLGVSPWLSTHNSVPPENDGSEPSTAVGGESVVGTFEERFQKVKELLDEMVSEYPQQAARPVSSGGRKLRDEAVESDMKPASWLDTLFRFLIWQLDYEKTCMDFEGTDPETGEKEELTVDMNTGYSAERRDEHYARIKGIERQVESRYESPMTAMLTFTASHITEERYPVTPVEHRERVKEGVQKARQALRRQFSTDFDHLDYNISDQIDDWCWMLVEEPHPKSAYVHTHLALFVDGDVEAGDFEYTMKQYCDHVDPAKWDVHKPSSDSVSVKDIDDEIDSVGAYIAEYLGFPDGDESIVDAPLELVMGWASIWAQSGQKVRYSQDASTMHKRDKAMGGVDAWDADAKAYRDDATASVSADSEIDWEPVEIRVEYDDRQQSQQVSDGGGGDYMTRAGQVDGGTLKTFQPPP